MKIENNINKLIIDGTKLEQLENLEELTARYDTRKSFYKKAHVGTYRNCLYLKRK